MGTPEFAVPTLGKLILEGHDVCAVYTQPDKPKGRGYILTPPPVKECAITHGIDVYQPKSLRDESEIERINSFKPDIIVVVAYGKILPKEVLDIPKYGCFNGHASLLPKYRGAAPIQWSVINGDKKTGITIMQMDVGLDTGDMLLKAETEIGENETSGELHDRLSIISADLMCDALNKAEKGTLIPEKQDGSKSSYASMLDKSLCAIDWSNDAEKIHNQIRGLSPWPIAVTSYNNKRIKIHSSKVSNIKTDKSCGEVISNSPLTVACGNGTSLELLVIQSEGSKKMNTEDFLRGRKIEIGESFE